MMNNHSIESAIAAATSADPKALRARLQSLREAEPGLRARELAARLQVSEAELVACRCGDGVTCLSPSWSGLIHGLESLGRVMVLTRNESCVHEKKGRFAHVSITQSMGLVLNDAIDLRLFLKHWVHAYAVIEQGRAEQLHSLQIFDADGVAVHKIYATTETDMTAWQQLVAQFTAPIQQASPELGPVAERYLQQQDDAAIDVAQLQADWRGLNDPHQFVGLLNRHKLGRLQALRLVGEPMARQVAQGSIGQVLESAAASGLGLMVFVGSPGVVQIHSGQVQRVQRMGPWLNVLDADFNLHLREDHVASSWQVKKPGPEGEINSLELYDAEGHLIVQVFGYRKPGKPELAEWRALADGLAGAVAERA
ncbi:hemin-degrading factor [Frateuria aurantia]